MARRSRGFRCKTRRKLAKKTGRITITKRLETFKDGERVAICIEPSVQEGMPHPRHNGKNGIVVEKRGKAYVVEVYDNDAKKWLIAIPEHLKRA